MRGCLFRMLVVSGLTLLALSGCSSPLRQPYPTDQPPATFEGFRDIRYYPGEYETLGQTNLAAAYVNEPTDSRQTQSDGPVVYNYLAVSGGGSDGAFGAGPLDGWTEFGDRPKLRMVTGVSGELELQYIAIPHEYVPSTAEEFNQQEMIQEYDLGYRMVVVGIPWKRSPPGYRV